MTVLLHTFRKVGIFATLCTLAGCSGVLTVQDDDLVHFKRGQKVRFIGPLNGGEHFVVLAVEDDRAPPHAWKIEPYVATRQSPGEYVLTAVVPGAAHQPGDEPHTIMMTVISLRPLEIDMTGQTHDSGTDHGGTVHLR